jgi:hypothetical protein
LLWHAHATRSAESGARIVRVGRFDKDEQPTEDAMRAGVKRCSHFLLFLTRGVLRRAFCRKEVRAVDAGPVPLLLLSLDARIGPGLATKRSSLRHIKRRL